MAPILLPSAALTLNKDTQELHHERVDLMPHVAQALSDKAVGIIRAVEARELPPRMAASSDFHICRFCPFHSTVTDRLAPPA